jgi:murein DD-endopeptidase MepM/ murein hydrolase activator NlpD
MLTVAVVTIVSGIQFYQQRNFKAEVPTVELTEERLQELSTPVPNQIVLSFAPGTTQEQKDEYIKSIGGTVSSESEALGSTVVNVDGTVAMSDMPKPDFVAEPEENYFVMALENPVNDIEYSNQWYLPVIDAPSLWNTGMQDEKVVAVIDSGICDQHADLQGRILDGYDFVEADTNPYDDNGHGCSVSGIIAANTNNATGIAGVGKNVKIMPLKVLDSLGVGTYSNVANAIVYAVDHGADIINLSLGGVNPSTILSNAVAYAETNNVTVVAAAGNTGTEGVLYPAAYPYVISVGATNENLNQSSFSSFGPNVDIFTPGEKILTIGLDNSYRYVSGTSYSAPIVSGILTMKNVGDLVLSGENVLGAFENDSDGEVIALSGVQVVGQPCRFDSDYDYSIESRRHAGYGGNNGSDDISPSECQNTDVIASISGTIDISDFTFTQETCSVTPDNNNNWTNPRITITSSDGRLTVVYLHHTDVRVSDGQQVQAGDVIATISNLGCADGSHIHFEVHRDGSRLGHGEWKYKDQCSSNPSGVISLYKDYGCTGSSIDMNSLEFKARNWRNLKDDQPYGFEDKIKSVKIRSGYAVELYQHYVNYIEEDTTPPINPQIAGFKTCITNSVSDLDYTNFPSSTVKVGLNVSSFKVYLGYSCNGLPSFCSDAQGQIIDLNECGGASGSSGTTNQGDSSDYISDITIPDKMVMGFNNSFTKTWAIRNNGTTTWNSGYKIAFVNGTKMGGAYEVPLTQNVAPGQTAHISVNMYSPNVAETYKGYWKLKNPAGQFFGDLLWVEIVTRSNASAPTNNGNGQVKLYGNIDYANLLGSYASEDTNHPNANSSSMMIPAGWSVKTYDADNFGGSEERCWYQSVPKLQDHGWQNRIRSMKVYNYMACGTGDANARVRLFSNSGYQGTEVGNYSVGKTQDPNNNSKSMHIPSGWSVKTYRQNDYQGERCWTESVNNLEDHGWQFDIDSLEAFPSNVCVSNVDEVRLFGSTGHSGTNFTVTTDIPNLGSSPIGNDNLRSYRIGGEWMSVFFQDENYNGNKRLVGGGEDNDTGEIFPNYGTTSIKVRRNSNLVELYDLGDLNGERWGTDRSESQLEHWDWRNRPESLRVFPGYEAVLCTEPGFHGTCGRTKTNKNHLNDVANGLWNNVGSFQVCKNECPAVPAVPTITSPLDQVRYFPGSNITFSWSGEADGYLIELVGGGISPTTFGWMKEKTYTKVGLPASTNSYAWRVKSWNKYGESSWSAPKSFYIIDTEVSEVEIEAPSVAEYNTDIAFSSTINPSDASNVAYTWSPAPVSGQGTSYATYKFENPGVKNITLTTSNTAGTQTDTHLIDIVCAEGEYIAEYYIDKDLTKLGGTECKSLIEETWGTNGPVDKTLPNLVVGASEVKVMNQSRIRVTSATTGTKNVTVDSIAGLGVGDYVRIIEMLGSNTGVNEKGVIENINGNVLELTTNLINTYSSAQVVEIERYHNATIDGTIVAPAWNGTTGGILALDITGELKVNGSINVNAAGYRGGSVRTNNSPDMGHTGEGYPGNHDSTNMNCWGTDNSNGNGGGAGHGWLFFWDHDRASSGGAGAGHKTQGAPGALPSGHSWCASYGGKAVGDDQLTRIYMGGGGGGGGMGKQNHATGGNGGNGGGIILIDAEKITVQGSIVSNGSGGRNVEESGMHKGAGGGGGAGGTILLNAKNLNIGTDKVLVYGGNGGASYGEGSGGGNGSVGRIKLQSCTTINGSTSGAYTEQVNCDKDNFSARYTKTINITEAGDYDITVDSDDGVKVWIDNTLVIDQWSIGSHVVEETVSLTSGNHDIKVEYYESTGDAKLNFNIERAVVQQPQTGIFTGEFFNNKTLDGTPVVTNTTTAIDYGWGGSPFEGVNADNFSARWTGNFNFPTTGEYTFIGGGDDGIRLYVDDVEILNGWVDQGYTEYQGVANLTAGTHIVRFEYYESGGGANATLTWEEGNTIPVIEACTTNNNEYCAKYFNNQTLSGTPALTRREVESLDRDWGQTSPSQAVASNDFSARWEGKFDFQAGNYIFEHQADDGIRAWIDNVLFIDRWNGQSYAEIETTKLMTAGLHDIKVEFLEWGGSAAVEFEWTYSGQPTNSAPVVTQIPGQTINQGQTFSTINLSNFVTDPDAGDVITWTKSGNTNLTVDITNNVATITAPSGFTGTENITFKATDAGGLFAESTAAFVVNAVVTGCPQNQFSAKYFNNMNVSGTEIDGGCSNRVAFDWGGGSPSGVNPDNFSAKYEGNYTFEEGTYTFTTLSDNGVRLYVDNVMKIDQWVSHSPQTDVVDVQLTAGSHAIKLEYFENLSSARINLDWNLKKLSTNPLVRLRFNENTGNTISNSGSLLGILTKTSTPGWSTNKPSIGGYSSLDFGTTNAQNYIESANPITGLGGLQKFTITGWLNVKSSVEGGGGNRILTWLNGSDNGVDLVVKNDGSLQIGIDQHPDNVPARSNASKIPTSSAGDNSNWRFFAITYDPALSTDDVKFYFGSQTETVSLDKAVTYDRGNVGTSVARLAIGHFNNTIRSSGTADRMFKGMMDEINIFGSALTLEELTTLQGFTPSTPTNTAPVVSQIPGQTITQGNSFSTINLSNYVSDPGDTVTWSYSGNTNLTIGISNNVATITAPGNFTGTENVTFKATDSGGLSTSAFTVNTASVGVELLTAPWNLSGNNGASEEYETIPAGVLAGKTTMRITYDLHGMNAIGGDASAIIFDQNGWKYISLANYGQNGLNGVQTVDIPLSAFTGLNLTTGSTSLHTRFWYGSSFAVDITSIKVF